MSGMSYNSSHPYWGSFATTSDLPNVSGADVQSAGLEVGDFAFCIADSTHYKCTTATPGAAVWAAMGGGSAAAPESFIVVGNSPAGDTVADCDYLDTGNGAQLAAAITAANARGIKVYVRSGVYDLSLPGGPAGIITVTCHVVGTRAWSAGTLGVEIKTRKTGEQGLFAYSAGSGPGLLQDVHITVQKPTSATSGSANLLYGLILSRVSIDFEAGWGATEVGYSTLAFIAHSCETDECAFGVGVAIPSFNTYSGSKYLTIIGGGSVVNYDAARHRHTVAKGGDYGIYYQDVVAKLEDCFVHESYLQVCLILASSGNFYGSIERCTFQRFFSSATSVVMIGSSVNFWRIANNFIYGIGTCYNLDIYGASNIITGNILHTRPSVLRSSSAFNVWKDNLLYNGATITDAATAPTTNILDFAGQSAIIVGNSAAGDTKAMCDYLDSGNGNQLFAAIAAHPNKTIFVRPGTYDLSAAGAPSGTAAVYGKLIGSGNANPGTIIKTRKTSSGDIGVFSMGGGLISDVRISIQTPTGTVTGQSIISNVNCERVVVIFEATWNATQLGYAGSLNSIFSSCSLVRDCTLYSYFSFAGITGGRQLSFLRDGSACKYQGCSGGGDYGVMCTGTSGSLIYACSLAAVGVSGKGIYAFTGCVSGKVTDCQISCSVISNTAKLILIDSTANRWTFVGNKFSITNGTTGAYLVDCSGSYTRFDNNEFAGTAPSRFVAGGNYNRVTNSIRPDGSVWTDAGTLNSFIDDPINFSISPIGGMMVPIINNSGGTLLAGRVLSPDTANNYSGVLSSTSDFMPIGIVYADIANGATGWMVIAGYADVYFDNVGAISRKDWAGVSTTTAGACTASAGDPGASHWREVGHVMQAITGPGLARCILHFN